MSSRIERALISVSDKTGLIEFARGLHELGIELFSTGGTARHIEKAGLPVRDVSDYTEFPEMMDGRLKTLHPKIFGGILCRHDRNDDLQAIAAHGIVPFGLIVVNLYPFEETVAKPDVDWSEAIEKIDIGGPSLVRAAAKNHAFVSIVTNPTQYKGVLAKLGEERTLDVDLRYELAAAAFEHTARYDRAIADYFSDQRSQDSEPFAADVTLRLQRQSTLRYGENPHQAAALYAYASSSNGSNLIHAKQLNGKELSYNNLLDADAALLIARSLPDAGVAVIKHNNPCGAASADHVAEATRKAMAGDPVSAFGSILGFNREVDAATAEYLSTPGLFVEAMVAPKFAEKAIGILTTKPKWKNNVRLLEVGPLDTPPASRQYRQIEGGMLAQHTDVLPDALDDWKVVTKSQPSDAQLAELKFAWAVVRHVKSNAIVLCRDRALVGAGAGQMSRVDSVQIAIRKADDRCSGTVLASDAFFPFADSIHEAAAAGVTAVIQPGGSRRDQEVIDACDQHGLAMVFTGRRHFKH